MTDASAGWSFETQQVHAGASPDTATGARATLMLELGLVAYLIAGVWGSYGRINMTYLMLTIVWVRSRVTAFDPGALPRS